MRSVYRLVDSAVRPAGFWHPLLSADVSAVRFTRTVSTAIESVVFDLLPMDV